MDLWRMCIHVSRFHSIRLNKRLKLHHSTPHHSTPLSLYFNSVDILSFVWVWVWIWVYVSVSFAIRFISLRQFSFLLPLSHIQISNASCTHFSVWYPLLRFFSLTLSLKRVGGYNYLSWRIVVSIWCAWRSLQHHNCVVLRVAMRTHWREMKRPTIIWTAGNIIFWNVFMAFFHFVHCKVSHFHKRSVYFCLYALHTHTWNLT